MVSLLYAYGGKMPDDAYRELLPQLPEHLGKTISNCHKEHDRKLKLAGKVLLGELLKKCGSTETLHQLQYNNWGKPCLKDRIGFNISHSGDIAVCCGGRDVEVGVDIELIRDMEIAYFEDSFNKDEWALINSAAIPLHEFYRLWVRKEAVVKAAGKGLSMPLAEIDVTYSFITISGITYHLYPIQVDPAYAACVATNIPVPGIAVEEVQIESK